MVVDEFSCVVDEAKVYGTVAVAVVVFSSAIATSDYKWCLHNKIWIPSYQSFFSNVSYLHILV